MRWPIYAESAEEIVNRLLMIVNTGDDSVAIEAISELRQMMAQNQKDEHHKAVIALESLSNRIADMASRAGTAIAGGGSALHSAQQDSEQ